jgi:hypothetical protein
MRRVTQILLVTLTLSLAACKEHKPEPSCHETVKVIERNGQRVIQAVNGLYLRADFPIAGCASKPYSADPWARTLVNSGTYTFYWWRGRFYDGPEYAALAKSGAPIDKESTTIQGDIGFNDISLNPAWWYQPAIPHQHYPIDLLPNFGLDKPDAQAGIGPIKTMPTSYWAVRGTKNPHSGHPYVNNYCSMNSPPNWDGKDFTFARDVRYLVQASTTPSRIGNTCRGGVWADNGKPIGARVDIPGLALPDIDKIYQAISQRLSQFTVE